MSSPCAAIFWRLLVLTALAGVLYASPCVADSTQPKWGIQTVGSSGILSHNGTDIALDALGTPRIALFEGSARDLAYAEKAQGTWSMTVIDTIGDTGRWPSLQLDAAGNPHIAYYWKSHPDGTPAENLMYASRSAGTWNLSCVDNSIAVGQYCSLVLDAEDTPHITYFDAAGQNLLYATRSANTWSVETVDDSGAVGLHASMAIDDAGNVHVAYKDDTNSGLKYASRIAGIWTIEEVASINTVPPMTLSAIQSSLALDSVGNAHIVFRDELTGKSIYSRNTSGSWVTGVAMAQGQEFFGAFHGLAIAPGDVPTMSFFDFMGGDLRLATFDGIWWTYESIVLNGFWSALCVDANGNPHVSFHAPTEAAVKHAVKSDFTSDVGRHSGDRVFMTASPNPMRTSTRLFVRTPRALPLGLTIVDVRGRVVRQLGGALPPGLHEASWNGRDERGNLVGSGIYFVLTENDRAAGAHKIAVLR